MMVEVCNLTRGLWLFCGCFCLNMLNMLTVAAQPIGQAVFGVVIGEPSDGGTPARACNTEYGVNKCIREMVRRNGRVVPAPVSGASYRVSQAASRTEMSMIGRRGSPW